MKRRSKLFLIVSLILIGAGMLLCLTGWLVSRAGGEKLFADKLENGERGYTYDFKDGDLDILKLAVDDANINIIGGSDKPHIEIINFNESLYTFDISNAMVTFRQSPDLSSIASFWEGGISFKGLRYFINPGTGHGTGTINIYVGSDEYIKVYDLTCTKGSIKISDVDSLSDWQIRLGSGDVSMKNVTGASTVNITSKETGVVNISIDSLSGENVNITAPDAKTSAKELRCRNLNVQQSHGAISIDHIPADDECTVSINTEGKLSVNGENYIDSFKYPEKDSGTPSGGKTDNGDEEKNVSAVSINTSVSSADASVAFNTSAVNKENTTEKDDKQK